MSIASRKRNVKRPTNYSRPLFPGPDKNLIPVHVIGLFPVKDNAHNFKPHGKFCGVRREIKQLRAKARESKNDLSSV